MVNFMVQYCCELKALGANGKWELVSRIHKDLWQLKKLIKQKVLIY